MLKPGHRALLEDVCGIFKVLIEKFIETGEYTLKSIAFIDLEVSPVDGKVQDIGAVNVSGQEFHAKSKTDFAKFLRGSEYICGHNILSHDLKYIEEEVKVSGAKYFIDTLYWSPLLFPKKPYHKLLKDDKWIRDEQNNPLNDSLKAKDLFYDEVAKFERLDKTLKIIYYNLLKNVREFKDFFAYVDYKKDESNLQKVIRKFFDNKICESANLEKWISEAPVELSYAIAQLDVMLVDNASITPPWVLKQFPRVENVLQALKGQTCGICSYCKHHLDVTRGLKRWFGYSEFRTYDGEPLQEIAAQKAINGESLLAVFPTGGGKSITFQLPAFMQGENERGLTVVISPLQSLQKDQVDNLESKHNITSAVRLDGSLDPIERQKNIERAEGGGDASVKLASLLYLSPESLRSKSIEKLLIKRNVVRFVIDEAHCFSAWGQDFRTDYLYIAEFIKNLQAAKGNNRSIPVSCFTATAKQEVIEDIIKYFADNLDLKLSKVVSTSGRKNLRYNAIYVKDDAEKMQKLTELLTEYICPTIIYVSFPHNAESLAKELKDKGFNALFYHGKMKDKKDRIASQDAFTKGKCDIIVATKAFGMGVDKDNVGLVIHYNISTSLEDYVQEAGRAGRDVRLEAACYALFNDEDINKHFAFLSQIKITQQEIVQIWSAIKRLTNKRGIITASPREIAKEAGWDDEKEDEIGTRVATSVNALEQVHFLKRGQNMPKVYANSILAKNLVEATEKIEKSVLFENDREKAEARRVIGRLFKTRAKGGRDGSDDNNEHIDYIADREQLDTEKVVRIVQKLKELKILEDSKDLYAFLQRDGGVQAKKSLDVHKQTEEFLCGFLTGHEDDLAAENRFNKKEINAALQEACGDASIAHLNRILNFYDIKRLVKQTKDDNKDYIILKPYLKPAEIKEKSEKRIRIAYSIIKYLYNKVPKVIKDDLDTKVEFSVLELKDHYSHENMLFGEVAEAVEIEDALYYLKRIASLEIDGGFLVIYNRMSIQRLESDSRSKFTKEHYQKLDRYYESKKEQIHIIGEYLKLLSEDYDKALEFTHDYFAMNYDMFKHKYFYGRFGDLKLNMTQARYNKLFKGLSETQREIIDNRNNKYIAVIAGPGSGKTMLLTHKIASIYMQEDIKHEQILMLTFSRAAASEFKARLIKLIGGAANFIKIKTFHSYSFDLLGRVGNLEKSDKIVEEAVKKIQEKEVDNIKLTNAIMVIDEAQDMNEAEYALVRELMLHNEGLKIIAVGDDDQNIYEWRGSSSEFLGKLSVVEGAAKYELIENFRSKANLVYFANEFAKRIRNRLKTKKLVAVKEENGKIVLNKENGNISLCKLVSNNIEIPVVNAVLADKPIGSTCIIVKTNEQVNNIVGLLNHEGINAKAIQSNDGFSLNDLVEIRAFLELVEKGQSASIDADAWDEAKTFLRRKYAASSNIENVFRLIKVFESINSRHKYKADFKHFISESKLEDFITQDNTVLVSTIHQTKGRQFDNVYLALDAYFKIADEEYRKIYVAITRAKSNLHIQYAGDLFDNIKTDCLTATIDQTNYEKPDRITLSLSLRNVALGYFSYRQNEIENLRSGMIMETSSEGCFKAGKQVLKFSKAFMEEIQKQQERGYIVSKAIINHIVFWYPKDIPKEQYKENEIKIVLPNLEFVKKND